LWDNWPTIGNMIDTPRIARREESGQNIVEYALILAVILVVVAGSAWLIVHPIIGQ
jgi:Flp pilus assembly pilin Flp